MNKEIINLIMTTYSIMLPLLLGFIARQINKLKKSKAEQKADFDNMLKEIRSAGSELAEIKSKLEYDEAMNSRYRMVRVADEIKNGVEPSEDTLEQLAEDLDIYDSYCDRHPDYKNHKGRNSRRIIIEYERGIGHEC